MNFLQLDHYIRDLQRSGFDTVKLQVQFLPQVLGALAGADHGHDRVPFAFLVGNRGAMTGIGVSIAIAVGLLGKSGRYLRKWATSTCCRRWSPPGRPTGCSR